MVILFHMIIVGKNRKLKNWTEGMFPCAVCKLVGSNSILCHFCKQYLYKRYSDIQGRLKHNHEMSINVRLW